MDASYSTNPFADSQFRDHLNINYAPSDPLHSLSPSTHEAELTRLEALIHDLNILRDLTKNYIQSHRALISHPRRLLQDLVESIFLGCLPAVPTITPC
ncbi:hypothetical protein MVEN_00845800 [Mycena venus]|uniref:Uncharacterized protein n=1 Tax=Mycena venus TaxID=2733690 RepID=A0A8H7D418_9AGAR|nr:hypothetical protein MVEN_00845800 [Mycena venus]